MDTNRTDTHVEFVNTDTQPVYGDETVQPLGRYTLIPCSGHGSLQHRYMVVHDPHWPNGNTYVWMCVDPTPDAERLYDDDVLADNLAERYQAYLLGYNYDIDSVPPLIYPEWVRIYGEYNASHEYWLLVPIRAETLEAAAAARQAVSNAVFMLHLDRAHVTGEVKMVEMQPRAIPDSVDPASL